MNTEIKTQSRSMRSSVNTLNHGFPKLADNQIWKVEGYLFGKNVRKSPKSFDQWSTKQYIGESNGVHHAIGDGKFILILSIQFNKCR